MVLKVKSMHGNSGVAKSQKTLLTNLRWSLNSTHPRLRTESIYSRKSSVIPSRKHSKCKITEGKIGIRRKRTPAVKPKAVSEKCKPASSVTHSPTPMERFKRLNSFVVKQLHTNELARVSSVAEYKSSLNLFVYDMLACCTNCDNAPSFL